MNIYDIIELKKHGKELSREEIEYVVTEYSNDIIPDYQVSALLMAIYFKGLSLDETYYLTKAMIESGNTIDLSSIKGIKVDKHSTGGVGDTVSLVLGPLVASCGVVFAKMSGRGLGHTGGTLDKLESIPGMNINLSIDEFVHNCNDIHMAIAGQTHDVTPADKKLYALRDATATVDNISLIASSILSKKIAVGSDALVLDVKVGKGAFMKTIEEAEELSKMLVKLGEKFNRKTKAIITNMEEPLGLAVGNSLEVIEAINTLKGKGPKDLKELSLLFGSKLLSIAKSISEEEALKELEEALESGMALEKFKEFVKCQGGDISYIDDISKFKLSNKVIEVKSSNEGYVKSIDALEIGDIARILGAGRETKEDIIDLGAGIVLNKKVDDPVDKGELLATIYTDKNDVVVNEAISRIEKAFNIGDKNPEEIKLVFSEIE